MDGRIWYPAMIRAIHVSLAKYDFSLVPGHLNSRQHDRQATHAAVNPRERGAGEAWRSCEIPRERYALAAAAHKISRRGALKYTSQAALPIKFPAEAPLNAHLRPPCP